MLSPIRGLFCSYILIISLGKTSSVPFSVLDNLKAPIVAELDSSKIRNYINKVVDSRISNVTQEMFEQFQGRVDKGIKDALKSVSTKLGEIDAKLTTEKTLNSTCSATFECPTNLICLSGNCQCVSSDLYWTGKVCVIKPKECMDITSYQDGIYTIYPNGKNPVKVYCIMDGNNKWTVIQRRMDGSVNFDRTWSEYKMGFGSINGEYWLGNDNINLISSNGHHEISFYLGISAQQFGYANYSTFSVGDEKKKYILTISGYSGNTCDSMVKTARDSGVHNGHMFSTLDQDNDSNSGNCAAGATGGSGGWWYNNCFDADLNRRYSDGVFWYPYSQRLVKSIMMIRKTS